MLVRALLLLLGAVITALAGLSGPPGSHSLSHHSRSHSLSPLLTPQGVVDTPGNVLIVDTGNDRIVEITSYDQDWDENIDIGNIQEREEPISSFRASFCDGPNQLQIGIPYAEGGCDYSRTDNMFGPVWAQRLGCGNTLVVSAGREGCPDNRILLFGPDGVDYFWQYGSNAPGHGPGQLNRPTHAAFTYMNFGSPQNQPDTYTPYCEAYPTLAWLGNVVITDSGNNRIIVVDWCTKNVMWSFGPTDGPLKLNNPTMTQVLSSGNLLIADTGNRRILEISQKRKLVAQYNTSLNTPTFASRFDWTWVNDINSEYDLIGTELITDIGLNEGILLDLRGRAQAVLTPAQLTDGYGPPVAIIQALRVHDRNHYLVSSFIEDAWYVFAWSRYKQVFKFFIGESFTDLELYNISSATLIGDYTGLTVPPYFPDYPVNICPDLFLNFDRYGNICGYNTHGK